ncbi:MAG: gliding motility-associated C-terminal domain-containing protein [Salibacteraceae bacterium]
MVIFSIFGRRGKEGTDIVNTSKTQNLNLPKQLLALGLQSFFALCFILLFSFNGQSQCKKSASSCDLTAISGAFTPTATFLGCSTDTCSLYYLLPNAVSADSAENWANSLGGHLTSIHSQSENDSIVKWAAQAGITGSVWIGFNDKTQDGNFVWTDGSDSTFVNWKTNRPNGIGINDDCVQLYVSGADSGSWNDTSCALILPAIVKVSLCMNLELADDTICSGDTAHVIANPTFGSTPYSYVWQNASTNDTLSLPATSYTKVTVTVTDNYSCSIVDSAFITVDTIPVFDLGGPDTICDDSSFVIDAGPGYSYLWYNNSVQQKDSVKFAGDYWVQITDSNGCSATDTFTLVTDTIPNVSIGLDSTFCDGDTAIVTVNNIQASYIYLWQDGSNGTQFKTDSTTNITLTVTDTKGCSFTQSKIVTKALNPVVHLGGDTAVCDSNFFTINGALAFSYHQWNVNTDTVPIISPNITVNTPGFYYYFGLDTNNCPGYDTISVSWNPEPPLDLGNDTSICQFDSLTLCVDSSLVVRIWSTGDTTPCIDVSLPSIYSIYVQDTNGCNNTAVVTIANDTIPEIGILRNGSSGDTSICKNDSIYLHNFNTDPNILYRWNSAPAVLGYDSLVVDTAGQYILTVQDTNTCLNKDTLTLSIDSLPSTNLTSDTTFCVNDSIMLVSNPDTNYSHIWDGIDLNNQDTLWIKNAKTYHLTLIDKNTTCKSLDSVIIMHDTLPIINLGVDSGFCEGDTISLFAGNGYYSYNWSTTPLRAADTSHTIKVYTAGTYSVDVVDSNFCKASDSRIIAKFLLPLPNLGADKEFCAGTPVNEVLDPGAGYSYYNWEHGPQGDSTAARKVTVMLEGVYSVLVTDSNGCQNTDTMSINASFLPSIDLGPDTAFCVGDRFNLLVDAGPGFVKYEWFEAKTGTEVLLPTTGQILLIKDTTSTVVCQITDVKGCLNKDTMNVTINPVPKVIFAPSSYCEAAKRTYSEIIDAGGGYTNYIWSTGETTQQIQIIEAGEYYVTVTNNNNCNGVGNKSVTEIPKPNIDWTADSVLCEGQTIILDAQKPGYDHYWWTEILEDGSLDTLNPLLAPVPPDTVSKDVDSTVSTLNIDRAGNYKLFTRYYQAPFCVDSAFATVREDIYPKIMFDVVSPDTTLCIGETLRLDPNFIGSSSKVIIYDWQDGSDEEVYDVTESGLYSLSLRNDCGADISEVYVNFDDCSNIFIPNTFTPNGDGDNDLWSIVSLQRFLEYEVQVYNRFGQVIWESSDPEVLWDGTHMKTGEEVAIGKYIYRISYRSTFEYIEGVNSAPTREIKGPLYIVR